jgi:hypothetical protein
MARSGCHGLPRFALGLASGLSVEQAAEQAGIPLRTAYRRVQEPAVRGMIAEARAVLIRGVAGKLAGHGQAAVEALAVLLADESARVRLSAATALLGHLFRSAEVADLAEQVQELRRDVEALRAEHPKAPGRNGRAAEPAGPAP